MKSTSSFAFWLVALLIATPYPQTLGAPTFERRDPPAPPRPETEWVVLFQPKRPDSDDRSQSLSVSQSDGPTPAAVTLDFAERPNNADVHEEFLKTFPQFQSREEGRVVLSSLPSPSDDDSKSKKDGKIVGSFAVNSTTTAFVVRGPQDLPRQIGDHEKVAAVAPNLVYTLPQASQPPSTPPPGSNIPWNLKLISRNTTSYVAPPREGEGVDIYVLDTGVNVNHPDFQGRAHYGKSFADNGELNDFNGHGTHVSGIIGSQQYGVAKKANLIDVRVFGVKEQSTSANVYQGLQWSINQARASGRPSIINMSLSAEGNDVLLRMGAEEAVKAGVYVVAAAGNNGADACGYSPAGTPNILTVGASTQNNTMAGFSNYGKCVDLLAPGVDIDSTWIGGEESRPHQTMSGTSMAAPMVSGVLALLLAEKQFASIDEGYRYLTNIAGVYELRNVTGDTPNLLLYNGFGLF
ncbi:serine protease [Quaeritorhiza haematococci]|nr:serine protease [Quaeritorhiza haematococci]